MKYLLVCCCCFFAACGRAPEAPPAYTPGFGELMLNIQIHHAKLWFAGDSANWPLAEYEESLIRSGFKKLSLYHGASADGRFLPMIVGPLDSIDAAISLKDPSAFHRGFLLLTTTCNNCHVVTSHGFNAITVPVAPPIGNQRYSVPAK
ncbi:MAG TPA: hypothetical protein VL547_15530 [Dinghuibacter sp.]|uniref:hypothetical protein n=1 Tax=Dinghuibacter sp. TaxID=2024697 RepID=UPI002B966A4B|nr:hypothetical protein [Dinghuibacter sp.]HTJ13445.1 hypothetical protein [Dinghuibacter sp.]